MQRAQAVLVPLTFALITSSALAQISLTDDLNRTITLPSPAQRIVSLAPSITETLFALGAGDRIIGVTDYCNFPEEAKTKQRVGGLVNPSIEKIVSLGPDLIVMTTEGNLQEDFKRLESLGVPVFVTNPRTLEGIYKSTTDLGMLSGEMERALHVVSNMRQRVEGIRSHQAQRSKAMLVVSLHPLMVVGSGTFLAEVLDLAGGDNVAAGTGLTYPTFSREAVVAADPEVLILTSDIFLNQEDLLRVYPEWRNLRAFRNARVFPIDADLISRPGPRVIDGLEALHRILR